MRKIIRFLFLKPVLWGSQKFSSKPEKKNIYKALTKLLRNIQKQPGKKGLLFDVQNAPAKIIVFSDQHRGAKNGADDFAICEAQYIAALEYYDKHKFHFISLGDSEELWENRWPQVKEKNTASFEKEKYFVKRNAFTKIFGNHDLSWSTDLFTDIEMEKVYDKKVKVYAGAVIKKRIADKPLTIFLTHGHQGDAKSDGNWFSKFFVAHIWAPLQGYLRINPNTPAYNTEKKTLHNRIMYEWSALQNNLLLITGHTHQPVFLSGTHLERLYKNLTIAEKNNDEDTATTIRKEIKFREPSFTAVAADFMNLKPSYFNSGCCCFSDGDITGIEIEDDLIRLIKWQKNDNGSSVRYVLEEAKLSEIISQL